MADILTQLQTCLDQLATQFYATLCYLSTYHDHSPAVPPPNIPTAIPQLKKIPKNAPAQAVAAATEAGASTPAGTAAAEQSASQQQQQQGAPTPIAAEQADTKQKQAQKRPPPDRGDGGPPRPDSPDTFLSRQRELARDLIIKEQQIEYLISVLPGIASSEAEQEDRIKELAAELRVVEEERLAKRREMRRLREKVDDLLEAVSRGIGV